MLPFKTRMSRLVEQLAPTLPKGPLTDVLRTALGVGASPSSATPDARLSCLGSGVAPDLSAILRRRPVARRPEAPASTPGTAAGRFTIHAATTPAGVFTYKLFEPDSESPPTALVIMLHGCTQSADDFAAGTRMNALGQHHNLLVAYPEQAQSANLQRCWNWFLAANQRRDHGEAGVIATIAREVMSQRGIAPGRVFIAGLSAGGAMAAIMADAYPEIFAGVGIHSGLPTGSAHDVASAFAAMRRAGSATANETGPLARALPTIVFHGDADKTVDPRNAAAILARINAREAGLRPSTERGMATGGHGYVKTTGRDAAGRVLFESWTVEGAGHAWSGGSPAGTYTDPKGPDASAAMVRFFLAQIGVGAGRAADAA